MKLYVKLYFGGAYMNEEMIKDVEQFVNGLAPDEKDECIKMLLSEVCKANYKLGRITTRFHGFMLGAGIGLGATILWDVGEVVVGKIKNRKKKSEEVTD